MFYGYADRHGTVGRPTSSRVYLPRIPLPWDLPLNDRYHDSNPSSNAKDYRLSRRHPFKKALHQFDFDHYVKNVASVYNNKAAHARWGYECIRLPFILLPMVALLTCVCTLAAGVYHLVTHYEQWQHKVMWLLIMFGCLIIIFMVIFFYSMVCYSGNRPVAIISKFQLSICKRYLEVCHKPHVFIKRLLPEIRPDLKDAILIYLAGSAADGYGFFPALAADIGLDCIQIFYQDIDLNVVYVNYTVHPDQLVPTGVPGYVWVVIPHSDWRLDEDQFVSNCAFHDVKNNKNYLSADHALQSLAANLPLYPQVRAGHPVVKFSVPLQCQRGNYQLDIDMAFALPLKPWPPQAMEWVTRSRSGVSPDLISEIVKDGALLVAKGCPKRNCAHDLDWRLTFTQAEVKLFHHHAEDKKSLKLCYIILKFILKTIHLDNSKMNIKEGVHLLALRSYYLKTIYLWIAENPPEFCIKNPDMNRIFLFLIKQFHNALRLGKLPNYFLPKINLLADLDKGSIRRGLRALRMIRQKRNVYIHRFQMLWFDKFVRERWRGALQEEEKNPCHCLMQILTLG